jgi:phage terminase large subunit-like protein
MHEKNYCSRMAIIAETAADGRDVIVDGDSGILASSPPWDRPLYEPSKRRITWDNGAYATLYSGDDPEQLRGPQHSSAWIDEFAKFRYAQECLDQLKFGLRIKRRDGLPPRALFTTTPKPIEALKRLVAHPRCITVARSTYDNIDNLSPEFIAELKNTYEGTSLGQQEIHASILDEAKGALWTRKIIEDTRISYADNYKGDFFRVTAIGVDPQTAMKRNSTGIIAVSKGADGHGYVRADATGDYLPNQWARAAIQLFKDLDADYIVAEVNQGGEMVRHTIHSVDKNIPVVTVHARVAKQARAEPIAALYQQGRMHHIGCFGMLESQMVTWEPDSKLESPDRIDAMVWAARKLMITAPTEQKIAAPVVIGA